jgi:hypothetical protein
MGYKVAVLSAQGKPVRAHSGVEQVPEGVEYVMLHPHIFRG